MWFGMCRYLFYIIALCNSPAWFYTMVSDIILGKGGVVGGGGGYRGIGSSALS